MARKKINTNTVRIESLTDALATLANLASYKDIDCAEMCISELARKLGIPEEDLPIIAELRKL